MHSPESLNSRNGTAGQFGQVEVMGSGERAVLFLHGLFSAPRDWLPIMESLADRYRLIAPQLPVDRQAGRRRAGVKKMEDLTRHVAEVIDHFGLEKFVLCGNSLGGLVAIDYSLRRADRVAGLILAGSAGLYERNLSTGARPRPTRAFVRSVVSSIVHKKDVISEETIDEWLEAMHDRDYVRFVLRVSRATRDHSVRNKLAQLKMPTLIVWGRNDQVTPPSVAEAFRQGINHAQLCYIDDCGHAPNLEQPHAFTRLVDAFLPRCFAGADPTATATTADS